MINNFHKRRILISEEIFDRVSVMYTLRRPIMSNLWTNAVLRIRRDSDDVEAFVFFDGDNAGDTISLSSLISTSSNTTPSSTTLGTWIGANNGFVDKWIGITPNNTIDDAKTVAINTLSLEPQFISAGVIATKNSKIAVDFLTSLKFLKSSSNNIDLNSGNSFTILTVTNTINSTSNNTILGTVDSDNKRYQLTNDRRSNKILSLINSDISTFVSNTTSQENTSDQKLLTDVVTPSNLTGYYNGTIQGASVAWNGTYTNNVTMIGSDRGNTTNNFQGNIQEITIFPSDKTLDLTDLHTEINDYYSIY